MTNTTASISRVRVDTIVDTIVGIVLSILISAPALAEDVFDGDILLGRPTDRGVTISVMAFSDTTAYIEYGAKPKDYDRRSPLQGIDENDVFFFELNDLESGTEYYYRLRHSTDSSESFQDYAASAEYNFDTQKSPGTTFSFAVEADPHLGARTRFEKWCGPRCEREAADDKIYAKTVANILEYNPDFLVDLGDFFMTSQNHGNGLYPIQNRVENAPITEAEVLADVLYVRSLMTQGGASVPMMLVQGNHEAEDGARLDGTPNNLAVWAVNARKKYFPSPTDGTIYTGPTKEYDFIGRQDGYYSWQWGDALFVALDPFWEPNLESGPWGRSLGAEQFNWLKTTLESSDATFKFVFIHHLVGGCDNAFGGSRGGSLCSDYFEWGGRTPFDLESRWLGNNAFEGRVQNSDNSLPPVRRVDSSKETFEFEEKRPGWGSQSIQDLLLENNVQIVFHGHDHLYARETHANGIVYQEVPQPSRKSPGGEGMLRQAANQNYDYEEGVIVSGGGFVNVTVSPDKVTVEYVRTKDDCNDGSCGEVADSYTVLP